MKICPLAPLSDCNTASMFLHPKTQSAWVWPSARMSVSLASSVGSARILGSSSPACMHYRECHSQAEGSRQKSVGSLNPVNVEQHLIRPARRRARGVRNATTLRLTSNAAIALKGLVLVNKLTWKMQMRNKRTWGIFVCCFGWDFCIPPTHASCLTVFSAHDFYLAHENYKMAIDKCFLYLEVDSFVSLTIMYLWFSIFL